MTGRPLQARDIHLKVSQRRCEVRQEDRAAEKVCEDQQHIPGKGQRAESLLVPGAGPSEGLLLPALPSDPGCSVPETGWMVDKGEAE